MTLVQRLVAIALFGFSILSVAQYTCQVPCVHRMHPYDVVPCSHVCYNAYGYYPCHASGDAVPCIHPVHAYDVVYC
jgi:hypothetical protein